MFPTRKLTLKKKTHPQYDAIYTRTNTKVLQFSSNKSNCLLVNPLSGNRFLLFHMQSGLTGFLNVIVVILHKSFDIKETYNSQNDFRSCIMLNIVQFHIRKSIIPHEPFSMGFQRNLTAF